MLVAVQMKADRPGLGAGWSRVEGLRMRRTRIEKRRRPARARRFEDGTHAWSDVLDPRDADIVHAKRLQRGRNGGIDRP
ncbi:hypothetical protein GCM10022403_027830 [Streptomyces coacervatus]|uniref:Uncharacterized protein n=1 Tax=Streptomyces coacervatus TaxID=647381 RepID=A0ABP7HFT6_9ACTN|nr:hypothetical protein [Streptomyces coacervatus]MDF2265482.1 hypothetical protein [Streptomyces coacervatus]